MIPFNASLLVLYCVSCGSLNTSLISETLDEFSPCLVADLLFSSSLKELFCFSFTARGEREQLVAFFNRNLSHVLFAEELFTLFTSFQPLPPLSSCTVTLFNRPLSQAFSHGFVSNIPA